MTRKKKAPRRAGRPSIFDEGLSMKDLQKVYEEGLSCRAAAAKLGCDPKTYRKYAKAAGFDTTYNRVPAGPNLEFANGYRVPQLLLWVREHPHRKLPRSMAKIAEVTEIPFGTVRSYLRRRKGRVGKWVRSLGDLRALEGVVLIDTTGRHVPVELITTYTLAIDHFDLRVKLALMLKGGIYLKAELPWKEYVKLFGKDAKEAPWVPTKRTVTKEKTDDK